MNVKTKKVLKGIVKECLIELLAEGLVNNNADSSYEKKALKSSIQEAYKKKSESRNTADSFQKKSYIDSITSGMKKSDEFEEKISSTVSKLTNDSLMSEILADTAKTTLQEQRETSKVHTPSVSMSGDAVAKFVDNSTPDELFGGAAANWANLAFADSK